MTPISFSLLLSGVLLNAAAQLLLKAGTNRVGAFAFTLDNVVPIGSRLIANPPILAGLACYVVSVVVWILGLSRVPVSQAYPLLSLGYVLNIGLAWWLLGEVPNVQRVAGIGVIVVGVVLVARS